MPEILREAANDPRRLDEYLDQIERVDPARLLQYEEATGIALARANVDFSGFQTKNAEAEERRLMPRYVEQHFLNAAREIGLKVEARADGLYRVEHVLADLRSDRLASLRRLGKPETFYRKVTFHKEHLEMDQHIDAVLIGPGHPLYAAVDERLNEMLAPLTAGVGVLWTRIVRCLTNCTSSRWSPTERSVSRSFLLMSCSISRRTQPPQKTWSRKTLRQPPVAC